MKSLSLSSFDFIQSISTNNLSGKRFSPIKLRLFSILIVFEILSYEPKYFKTIS